jgi:hypothetical protein
MSKLTSVLRHPAARLAGYTTSLIVLAGGLILSIKQIDIGIHQLSGGHFSLALATTILGLYMVALRFRLSASTVGAKLSVSRSLWVVTQGGIANLLPLPGNLLVRWYAVAEYVGAKQSTYVNVAVTSLWAAISFLLAASALIYMDFNLSGASLFGAFLAASAVYSFFIKKVSKKIAKVTLKLSCLQGLITLLYISRLWLIGQTVGIDISTAFCALLSISALAGSVSGFFPAGMGIVEAFGAALAVMTEQDPAQAFIILAASRVLTISSLCFSWSALYLRGKSHGIGLEEPHEN